MNFEKHSNLSGLHAPFSASQSAWLRYDDEKVIRVMRNKQAAILGTQLHDWAKTTIDLGIKQPTTKKTLYMYVNDAIGFKMSTEVLLFYSNKFFGTADTISFDEKEKMLRIHDLKTGEGNVHMEQLLIYAALFCLEYKKKPGSIDIELRIYQKNEIQYLNPTAEDIVPIMDKIIHLNKILEKLDQLEG